MSDTAYIIRTDRRRGALLHRRTCQKAPEFYEPATRERVIAAPDHGWCHLCCRAEAAEARARQAVA